MKLAVIIPAAGIGQRFGGHLPKQYVVLGSLPIIVHTLNTVLALADLHCVVVAKNPADIYLDRVLDEHGIADSRLGIVDGGEQRADSVRAALAHPSVSDADVVLVHDAVRPLASASLFYRIAQATRPGQVVIPGIPISDTLKEVDQEQVVRTIDRSTVRAVQTPQGFLPVTLRSLYQASTDGVTDEAMLAERMGIPVTIIPGEPWNIKITTPADHALASILIGHPELAKNVSVE